MIQFSWRRRVEQDLIDTTKNEKKMPDWDNHITSLRDMLNRTVSYLDENKNTISRKNRMTLYNYIVILKYQIEVTTVFKERECQISRLDETAEGEHCVQEGNDAIYSG